jgi:hypothetical protein
MLDTTFKQNFTFNSVAGTLIKSHKDSKFTRFHLNSSLATRFFDADNPRIGEVNIVVLQVMLCAKEQFLAEYIDAKDGS